MDSLSPRRRSENMRAIRSKDTGPERTVRGLVHAMGFRFRLHGAGLPGKPDLVFRRLSKVIFVHGCFWHGHARCREGRIPDSRREYWEPKLARTKQRDAQHVRALRRLGWGVLVLWECEIERGAAESRIRRFLGAIQ